MKKLLETSLGNWSETAFLLDNKRLSDEDIIDILSNECSPYMTKEVEGVIVYMSKQEYENIQKKD